jgi:DNA modification methylase
MSSTIPPNPIRQRVRVAGPPHKSFALPEKLALKIVERPLGELKPSARNARTHSDKQIAKIRDSVARFGFITPILIDGHDEIIAGHGRYMAAESLGMAMVPTIPIGHLSEDEIRAYRLADNRLAELAGWDDDLLKLELGHLVDIDFDVDLTGFDTPQIDLILDGAPPAKPDPADDVPEMVKEAVTRLGDIWKMGKHRIFCGDALERVSYEKLMAGAQAQMVFIDVPYNVKIDGHVGGKGKIKHRDFPMASGEMSKPEFTTFLTAAFGEVAHASADGALIYTCIDGPHMHEMLNAGYAVFDEFKAMICWAKTNAGMGSLYRSQTEFIPLWKKGKAPHINNIELGRHGRYRTTLWTYAGANTFRRGRMEELASHPTVKPCAMVMDAIKDCSKPDGIILDVFGGSGTTLIAAAKAKRRGYLMELDPLYVDVAVKRWQAISKQPAVHAVTGLTFDEMALQRASASPEAASSVEGDVDG